MGEHHVMVDIETLGNDPTDGVILSIGAVTFGLGQYPIYPKYPDTIAFQGLTTPECFYYPIQISSSLKAGLQIEGDTLRWWLQEGREVELARVLNDPAAVSITQVFHWFKDWLQDISSNKNDLYVWSHGATFDVVHLEQKYRRIMKQSSPFIFRNVRDTRTIYALYRAKFGKEVEWPVKVKNHHPLEDAYSQAVSVIRAWSSLCLI